MSGGLVMLSKIHKPKTKQELIKALQAASIRSVEVYEGEVLASLPAKPDLVRQKATVIVVRK
jgi:hypothetical protein